MIRNSIPQGRPLVKTVEDLFKRNCPECGHDLTVAYFHVGGYAVDQPHAVCQNPDGGYSHLRLRIPDWLAQEFWEVVAMLETDFGAYEEEQMEAENA